MSKSLVDPPDLEGLWAELEAAAGSSVGVVFKRVRLEGAVEMLVAVDHPSKRRGILFENTAELIPSNFRLPEVRGLVADVRFSRREGNNSAEISLFSRSSSENGIFGTVARDLAAHLAGVKPPDALFRALVSRLTQWARFFDRTGARGLSDEAQRGLYAELWFLKQWLLPHVTAAASLAAWKGPEGATHDFQFMQAYVEIKSSVALPSARIEIANTRQLDEQGIGGLYLFVLQLDTGAAGESLPVAVEKTRNAVREADPGSLSLLDDSLFSAGYIDEHAHFYEARRFLIRQEWFFHVQLGFPRIVDSDLRAGVGAVRYSVDLAACAPFKVGTSEILAVIRQGGQ